MMTEFPTAKLEFERQWTSCAAKLSGVELVYDKLLAASGSHYIGNQDDTARAFRNFASRIFQDILEPLRERLHEFIEESKRRGKVKQ